MEKGAVVGAGRKVEQNSDRRPGEGHSDQGTPEAAAEAGNCRPYLENYK